MADADRHSIEDIEPPRTIEVGGEHWTCRALGAALTGHTVRSPVPTILVGFSRGGEEVEFEALFRSTSLDSIPEEDLEKRVTKTRSALSD